MRLLRLRGYGERTLQHRARVGQGAGESMFMHLELCILSLGRSQKGFEENQFASETVTGLQWGPRPSQLCFPQSRLTSLGSSTSPEPFDFTVPGSISPSVPNNPAMDVVGEGC